MATLGRNDACPCGSGKKYKKCCLARDEQAAQARQSAPLTATPAVVPPAWTVDEDDDLDRLSNSVVDLIQQGRFDDAERARDELRQRFPDMIDWIERTAMIHQARGQLRAALDHWNKTLDYMRRNDGFDDEGRGAVRDIITKLEQQIAHGEDSGA